MAELQTVKAYIEGINQAPRKVSLVASLVRNRNVDDALVILAHTPKRAAKVVSKAIASAKANAINNHDLSGKTLVVSTVSVSTGTRMKRHIPASRGRALPIEKKSSNILVEVTGELKPKKATVKTSEAKKADTAKTADSKVSGKEKK